MDNDESVHHDPLGAYIAHNEALRKADLRFQKERDRRYMERDKANREALRVASATADKLSDKIEQALKEYKEGSNEWRKTVSDLIALQQGSSKGMRDMWGWVVAAVVVAASIVAFFK